MAKNRGRNEGSISERDGKYRAQVSLGDGSRHSKTFKTKKEAQAWIREIQIQVDGGLASSREIRTLGDYSTGFWLKWIEKNRRPRTYLQYMDLWRRFIQPAFGQVVMRDIRPIDVDRFIVGLQARGTGARTVQVVYAVLHAMMASAKKKRLIAYNPCDSVDKPGVEKTEMMPVNIQDANRLINDPSLSPKERAFYYLAITTGLRRGELLGLAWDNIDFQEECLYVKQQAQYISGQGTIICPVKTATSKRTIHLSLHAIALLKAHRENQQLEKAFAGSRWKDLNLVFPSSVGTPQNPSNLTKRFKQILEQAGIADTRFHNLRHGALTIAKNQLHAEEKVVEKIGGHSPTSRISMSVYVHAPQEAEQYKRLAAGFDHLFGFDGEEENQPAGDDFAI